MATLYLTESATQGARTLHIPITFVRKQPRRDAEQDLRPGDDCAPRARRTARSPSPTPVFSDGEC